MTIPNRFVVTETLKHHRPEYVRTVCENYDFTCRTTQGTSASEIWVKPDGGDGFWIIRLDSMGHDTRYFFGGRPHYHKNWIESQALLDKYLEKYTPEAWVYSDAGVLLGRAGTGNKGGTSDRKAKLQHIPR